jgi:hypothetical protein
VFWAVDHHWPLLPLVLLLVPVLVELVAEGIVKSPAVCVVLLTAVVAGVVAVVVPVLPELGVPVLVLPVLVPVVEVEVVPDVVVGARKAIPLDEPVVVDVVDKLLVGIAALSEVAAAPSVANKPELAAVAEGLEPAVTVKVAVPSLESSKGAPEAGVPPSRLIPIT